MHLAAACFLNQYPSLVAAITNNLPPGITLVSADNLEEWFLDIKVLDQNPLYAGQTYRLKFKFSNSYPIEAPEVTFVKLENRPIPMHPHIYSNGIICLDLLGSQGWSPVQSVESVCMSIQSMLTGNTKNERPPGDEEFVRGNRQRPRDIAFYYHDNTVIGHGVFILGIKHCEMIHVTIRHLLLRSYIIDNPSRFCDRPGPQRRFYPKPGRDIVERA
ncbi:hypothetical protein CHU98_g580 [Xylaria longipes]|nr:hypothetical protein CHU98_g580 [Xylaria longipes]